MHDEERLNNDGDDGSFIMKTGAMLDGPAINGHQKDGE